MVGTINLNAPRSNCHIPMPNEDPRLSILETMAPFDSQFQVPPSYGFGSCGILPQVSVLPSLLSRDFGMQNSVPCASFHKQLALSCTKSDSRRLHDPASLITVPPPSPA